MQIVKIIFKLDYFISTAGRAAHFAGVVSRPTGQPHFAIALGKGIINLCCADAFSRRVMLRPTALGVMSEHRVKSPYPLSSIIKDCLTRV